MPQRVSFREALNRIRYLDPSGAPTAYGPYINAWPPSGLPTPYAPPPSTPVSTPQAPAAADPLATLASLYGAASGGAGAAQTPQYIVGAQGGTGGGLNYSLVGLAVVAAIGWLVYKWYKKHHGGKGK